MWKKNHRAKGILTDAKYEGQKSGRKSLLCWKTKFHLFWPNGKNWGTLFYNQHKILSSFQHNSSIVFTNCTWQIIRDRTLSTAASETWIISEFPTLRIIDTVSNHSLLHIIQRRTIKILLAFGSGWSKNVSNITTKETGMFSTWSHKWSIQNEKTNLQSLYNETELSVKLWARILFYFAGDIALHVYPYCCLRLAGYLHL